MLQDHVDRNCVGLVFSRLPILVLAGINPDKFYKGECQEKVLPRGRIVSYFPARMVEQDLFQPSAP